MAFNTLANFYIAVNSHLDKSKGSTINDSNLADLVTIAENKTHKKLRVRQMETALAATLGTLGTCAVPTDYLDDKFAYINTSPVQFLQRKTPLWIYEKFPDRSAGTEQFFAREGSDFIFGEAGNMGRVMKGIYYAKPTAMSATINSVFSAYPEVYLFAVLSECEPYIGRDPRIQLWEQKWTQTMTLANQQDKDENLSGGPLSSTTS